jgi:hypothetical protein
MEKVETHPVEAISFDDGDEFLPAPDYEEMRKKFVNYGSC